MNPRMYTFLNEGLGMSVGKAVAQGQHAAVRAYELSTPEMIEAWNQSGHYTKIVLSARDSEHLLVIDRYLRDRGFETALIIDEGRTEIPAHTPTALGVPIVDKDDPEVAAAFSTFDLVKAPKKPEVPVTYPEKGLFGAGAQPLGTLMNAVGQNFSAEDVRSFVTKLADEVKKA